MIQGTIVKVDTDTNGAIRVWSQYKIDGQEIVSQYPKIDGKSVYCTRYDAVSLTGLTKEEIQAKVLKDVEQFVDVNVKKEYLKTATPTCISDNFSDLVGQSVSKDSTLMTVSGKEITLNQTGTTSVKEVIAEI